MRNSPYRVTIRVTMKIAVAFGLCFALPAVAAAQGQSMFGNRGPSSQIGSNLRGSAVGNSAFGGTLGGRAAGYGSLGGQSLGGGTSGFGSAGGTTGFGGATAGATGMQNGLVGRNDNTGRFGGNQQVGQQGGLGAAGAGRLVGGQQFGNRQSGGRRGGGTGAAYGGQQQGQRGGRQGQSAAVIRPRHEIAFSYTERPTAAVRSSLGTQFDKVARRESTLQGVNVAMDEPGIVVLRGEVESAEASRLAAIMARLEPGVREVRNELTIRSP